MKNKNGPNPTEKPGYRNPMTGKTGRVKHVKGCPNLNPGSGKSWKPCKNCS